MRKNTKEMTVILMIVLFLISMLPVCAFAADISLTLSPGKVAPGELVTATGQSDGDTWISIKILNSNQSIVYYDAIKSDLAGNYSFSFSGPEVNGLYTVVSGYGDNVANQSFLVSDTTISNAAGGGGATKSPTVSSTTGIVKVIPSIGGTISLGSEAVVELPAGALQETGAVEVKVQKVTMPSTVPTGFKLAGNVYEFSVGGKNHYSFNKNVTIKLSFDTSAISAGEIPAIHYYNEDLGQWVNLGGNVSGNTVIVQVNHFTKFAVMVVKKAQEQSTATLKDITGHWALSNINKLVDMGAINGYPDGNFKPSNNITRAEFAAVLVNAFKLAPQNGKVFSDTAKHWAKDCIATAAASGIVNGYDNKTFGPNDLITREQMAAMIVKAAKLPPTAMENHFTDSSSISEWAQAAIAIATQNGIIHGYPDNTVRPLSSATRAEAVTVIVNALNK